MEFLFDPNVWIAFAMLTALEIVLGIDNIIFISILVGRLPADQRDLGRRLGLGFAMLTRLVLLFSLTWVMGLTADLFTLAGNAISGRDLVLLLGGVFLLYKAFAGTGAVFLGGVALVGHQARSHLNGQVAVHRRDHGAGDRRRQLLHPVERADDHAVGARDRHLLRVHPARPEARAGRPRELAQACAGVVAASGGDGTINTVAQAALGSPCALGVLPHGTFNYFSRVLGILTDTAQAVRVILRARAQPVQIGLVNGRVFLVNASLGLYA